MANRPTDGTETVRAARERYFAENGLSEAGYRDRWVVLRAGPVRFFLPNTPARRRAVPLHDLHHVATGYATTWTGEGEIAAWELGAGCGRYWAAWGLNLGAFAVGMVIAPRRTVRALGRGRRGGRSLYRDPAGDAGGLLDLSVADLRARLALD
ncbi:MAG TPA: hypothetical protein VK698_35345 [Kofleriaceae bacterium]|nr:hypothetical protein [Kofleriaceae bacterium]